MPLRPSAGIGVVEVQKPMVFCDFQHAHPTLCRDRHSRGAKTRVFLRFLRCSRNPLRGLAWSRCKNFWVFLRFLRCPRNPLRGSSKCKNSRFFAISMVLAQPSTGFGVVEVENFEVFVSFVVRTNPRELSRGSRAYSRNRRVAGSIHQEQACKMQLAF